jgi:branched-chain amino acid transport system permease protein
MTPNGVPTPSWFALQFADKRYFYALALVLWLFGLWVWRRVQAGIASAALEAISEDEGAAAAIGIHVTRQKLRITLISAAMTALGGGLYGQFVMYLNPDTLSGVGVSLQIVFAAIAGGMYSMLGPTVGAVLTIVLGEALRVSFGTMWIGAANTIYGILLVLFIIYMPRGIVGLIVARLRAQPLPIRRPAL